MMAAAEGWLQRLLRDHQPEQRRSLALDLKSPQGLEIILELAGQSDVIMRSSLPGWQTAWAWVMRRCAR